MYPLSCVSFLIVVVLLGLVSPFVSLFVSLCNQLVPFWSFRVPVVVLPIDIYGFAPLCLCFFVVVLNVL